MPKTIGVGIAAIAVLVLASGCGRTSDDASTRSTLGASTVAPTLAPTVLAETITTQPPAEVSYVVQSGDSLSIIAERFGVSLQQLADFNSISDANSIKVGQSLAIPPVTATTTTAAG